MSDSLHLGRPLAMTFVSGTPEEFWLQKSSPDAIGWIQTELLLHTDPGLFSGDVRVGDVYSVLNVDDDCFYRGKVEDIQKNNGSSLGNLYTVRLIDHGHVVKVLKSEIHALPEELANVPANAFRCSLQMLITPSGNYAQHQTKPAQLERSFQLNRNLFAALWRNSDRFSDLEPDFLADIARHQCHLEAYLKETETSGDHHQRQVQSRDKVSSWLQGLPNDNDSFRSYDSPDPDDYEDYERASRIPTLELKEEKGSKVECVVEHVEHPGLFYVHLTEAKYDGDKWLDLPAKLAEFLHGKSNGKDVRFKTGEYVAVREMRDAWIRGQIEGFDPGENTYTVFLIDYGDTIGAKASDLRYLPLQFGSLPKFALPCALRGIQPLSKNGNRFSEEATNHMKHLARDSLLHFVYDLDNQDLPLEIELFKEKSSFANALVSRGLAQWKRVTTWDPMTADFLSPSNVPGYDHDLLTQELRPPEERLCKFFRANGRCARRDNCRFLHVQTGSSFFASDEDSVMTVAHHEITPEVGAEVHLEIPVVRHLSNFYAIFLLSDDGSTPAKNGSSSLQLSDLTREMTRYYRQSHLPNAKMPHIPGEVVAAKFEDDRWYRARIIDVYDNDDDWADDDVSGCIQKVRLFFVDFGHSWTSDILSIREILPHFLTLPFQAIECSLANVVPYGGKPGDKWPREVNEEFRRLTSGNRLKAKILNDFGCRLELELLANLDDKVWMDVAQYLIDAKMASPHPTTLMPTGGKIIIPG